MNRIKTIVSKYNYSKDKEPKWILIEWNYDKSFGIYEKNDVFYLWEYNINKDL